MHPVTTQPKGWCLHLISDLLISINAKGERFLVVTGCTKVRPSFVLVDMGPMHSNIPPEPSPHLFDNVLRRIGHEKQRVVRRRFAFFSLTLASSAIGAIPAFQWVMSSFAESGSLEFLSLIFSDFGTVSAYWRSFGFALLESLPVLGIIALLGAVFVFLQSLRLASREYTHLHPFAVNS